MFFVVLALGCVRYVVADYHARFRIVGTVFDQEGKGKRGVEVGFEDTGLDFWVGGTGLLHHVAWSDQAGRVAADFNYTWGIRSSNGSDDRLGSRTFNLVLREGGVILKKIGFHLADLERCDGAYCVFFEATLFGQNQGKDGD